MQGSLRSILGREVPRRECYSSPSLLLLSYTTSDIIHTIFFGKMAFEALVSEGQLHIKLSLDTKNSQLV